MADPFSTSDGVEQNFPGSSGRGDKYDLTFRIGDSSQDVIGDLVMQLNGTSSAPDITSSTELIKYCLNEYAVELNSTVHMCHSMNRLLGEFNRSQVFPDGPEPVTIGKVSFGNEDLNNSKTSTIHDSTYGILSNVDKYLRTSTSNAARVVLYMGMNDLQNSFKNVQLARPQERRLDNLWPSIESQLRRSRRNFVGWLQYDFVDGTPETETLREYDSLARDFGQMYADIYHQTEGYKLLESEFGGSIHDNIEELIEELTDVTFNEE